MTVKTRPFSVTGVPTTAGSAPSRSCQSAWESTTTGAAPADRSSSGRKFRPSAGLTPSMEKKLALTSAPCRISPWPPRLHVTREVSAVKPPISLNTRLWSR